MRIRCKYCGTEIEANVLRGTAKCPMCNGVTRINENNDGDSQGSVRKQTRFVTAQPGVQIAAEGSDLIVRHRWSTAADRVIVIVGMCIVIAMLYWQASSVASLAFVAVTALPLVYMTVALILNTTLIRINEDILSIRHGPVPWPRNRELPIRDIEQLYCVEIRRKTVSSRLRRVCCVSVIEVTMHATLTQFCTTAYDSTTTVRISIRYQLRLRLRDGTSVKLTSKFISHDQALYIEQQVEKHLRIEDTFVDEEMKV